MKRAISNVLFAVGVLMAVLALVSVVVGLSYVVVTKTFSFVVNLF
jgi:hypothetical protein